jgi:Uncharacterized small protein
MHDIGEAHSKGAETIRNTIEEHELQKVFEMVKQMHYGSITIVIQDGRIVQIEKNEKIRIK